MSIALRAVEDRGELRGRSNRVVDQEGVREDRGRVLGHGELDPVPVADRAAARGHVELGRLLGHGSVAEVLGLHASQPRGAPGGHQEEQEERGEEEADPLVDQPHGLAGWGGGLGRRTGHGGGAVGAAVAGSASAGAAVVPVAGRRLDGQAGAELGEGARGRASVAVRLGVHVVDVGRDQASRSRATRPRAGSDRSRPAAPRRGAARRSRAAGRRPGRPSRRCRC